MIRVPLKWKLKTLLTENGLTPYRFVKESGLSASTVYRITGGKSASVQGETLERVLDTLFRLTGTAYTPADVLEWRPGRG